MRDDSLQGEGRGEGEGLLLHPFFEQEVLTPNREFNSACQRTAAASRNAGIPDGVLELEETRRLGCLRSQGNGRSLASCRPCIGPGICSRPRSAVWLRRTEWLLGAIGALLGGLIFRAGALSDRFSPLLPAPIRRAVGHLTHSFEPFMAAIVPAATKIHRPAPALATQTQF